MKSLTVATSLNLLSTYFKNFTILLLASILMLAGASRADETVTAMENASQLGVELLFPYGAGKQAKGDKPSKEEKNAASLLKKLKSIEEGSDINATDKLGQTALMHAAAQGNRLAVCWLVAKDADAAIKSKSGKTAGELAHGDLSDFLTALEKEKQPLSRQEARDMYAYQGVTPEDIEESFYFSEEDLGGTYAILQLRGTKDLNKLKNEEWKVSNFSGGPMKLALLYRIGARKFILTNELYSEGRAEQLQLLRALGMKADIVNSALQMKIALRLKQKETVLELLKQDPALLQNQEIFSSISDAKTLQALLDAGLDAKNEKLMEAIVNKGDGAMLRTLLKAGATVPDPNKPLESKYGEKNAAFILALIDAGAKSDALNTLPVEMSSHIDASLRYKNSATLLHQAANEANLTEVQILLAHGADPNAPGKKTEDDQREPYGMTPLMAAANSARCPKNAAHRTEIVKRLLEAGADVQAKDSAGNGVIYYAACGGLNDHLYFGRDYRVDKKVETDILSMVNLLIKAGAEVPKDILAQAEMRPEISPAGREKLALMMLDAGANPLAKNKDSWFTGWTTLMVNGIWGSKIAKRLVDAGVDLSVKCKGGDEGESAMSRAMAKGAVEVVKLLKERGIAPGELQVVEPENIEPLLKLGARIPKDMTDRLMSDYRWADHSKFPARLCADYVDIIQILKQHGYKPELMAWTKKDHSDERFIEREAEFFRAFFKTGENPNETDENGNSLLANFVSSTKSEWRTAAVLPAFIEAGVDVNKPINQDGQTPLFYAEDAELIAQLFRADANAHVRDVKGRTPLFPCFFNRDVEAVRLLMQRGIRINTQDNEGNTALMMAVTKDSSSVQALLDAGANPNIKNKAGKTALQIAQENKIESYRNEIVKLLKEHGAREEKINPNAKDKDGRTTLMQAALDPDGLDRLKECIARKGNVNARDNKGCTALRLLFGQDGDINSRVQELLNARADVNLGDSNGFTPLMAAACYNDTAKRRFRVRRLINAKVNVNAAAKAGNTAAMHLLIHYDDPDTLRMLLDAGAKLDHKNGVGKTMLDLAMENNRSACVELLNERKAPGAQTDPKARDSEGRTPLMLAVLKKDGEEEIQSLLRQGADINARDNRGNTALHYLLTVRENIDARLDALLAAHPDVNLSTHLGTTPLMILDVCADPKERASRIKKLLACHAKADLKDAGGKTAAMRYVEKGDNAEALQLLLDAGANPELKNKDGKALLQLAQEYKRTACVRVLQEHLAAAASNHWWWYIIGGVLLVLLIGAAGLFLRRRTKS